MNCIKAKLNAIVSRGVKEAHIDSNGHLIFTLTDNTTEDIGKVNGEGISGVTKTGTSGLVDTYTIAYTSGDQSSFTVTNGKGITSIVYKEEDEDGNYVYTVNFNDGTSQEIVSPRGPAGSDGAPGADGQDGRSAYASAMDGGYTGTEAQFNSDLAGVGDKIPLSQKGFANGVASLGSDGKIPTSQLPIYDGSVT